MLNVPYVHKRLGTVSTLIAESPLFSQLEVASDVLPVWPTLAATDLTIVSSMVARASEPS